VSDPARERLPDIKEMMLAPEKRHMSLRTLAMCRPTTGARPARHRSCQRGSGSPYQFTRHTLLQGHIAARSGDALLRFVGDTLSEHGVEHAATGLAAAWALTHFASFRIATVYLPADPSPDLVERLGFREDPRGSNLWLVVPNDSGVFQGAVEKDGIRCVHPAQVYLDLKEHPERSAEAADRLRAELVTWSRDG